MNYAFADLRILEMTTRPSVLRDFFLRRCDSMGCVERFFLRLTELHILMRLGRRVQHAPRQFAASLRQDRVF